MHKPVRVLEGRRVPTWAMEHLGCKVKTTVPVKVATQVFPAGSMAVLHSIQAGRRSPYATIVIDGDPVEAEESMPFHHLRPL
jgi:hypothetical protein